LDDRTENGFFQYPPPGIALLVLVATFVLVFLIGRSISPRMEKFDLLILELFTLFPALIFIRFQGLPITKIFRLHPVPGGVIFFSVLVGLSTTILTDEVDRLVSLAFPMPEGIRAELLNKLQINTPGDFAIIFSASVLVAPLVEEMLFRGFLQNALEHRGDVTRAVMGTAAAFAIFHFNPWWLIQILILGTVLGVMAWAANSLLPGIIVHGINNGLALFLFSVPEGGLTWYQWKGHVSPWLLGLSLVVLIVAGVRFWRACRPWPAESA